MNRASRRPSARRFALAALALVLVPAAAFVLLEGASSLLLFVQEVSGQREPQPLARLRHTRYDAELGWSHVPNVRIDDMYGPGAWLQTNGQGFRAERDFSREVPPGHLRVICSGDSFTLGYGVANDETWCARLEGLDPRIESVNMGQAGYGIDQAYLWFRRDGRPLARDVHVFAFILDDFRRMQERSFMGYGKPVLAVRDGRLVVENTPVPPRRFYDGWGEDLQRVTADLRTTELVRRLLGRPRERRAAEEASAPTEDPMTFEVWRKVLDDLAASSRAAGSELLLVYLPTPADYRGAKSDTWRRFTEREAAQRGLPYLDLVAELRRLPAAAVEPLFIRPGAIRYRAAAGHLTPKGNDWVARRVYDRLAAEPAVAARLQAPAPGR